MRRVVVTALIVLGVILFWTVATDKFAPRTPRAYITASVIQIAPRVSGRVVQVHVADNTLVSKGDPLFDIDRRPFEYAVERARASLDQATQGVAASTSEINAAQARVAEAQANVYSSRENANRVQALYNRGISSQAANTNAQAALEAAQAALVSARESAESARRQLGVAGADNPQIRAAEYALEQAEYDLISTQVKAPSDGFITNLHLYVGQYVSAGSPSLTFVDREAAWIVGEFRENQLDNIDPGDPASIVFDAVSGRVFSGRVESLSYGIQLNRQEIRGLPVNKPINQWFEPARRIPVRIVLDGGMESWPRTARLGGKVDVLVAAKENGGPIVWLAQAFQRIGSYVTVLY